ncbi:neurogenic locus notch homolog protein 1-like [Mya arenaria]|uniref:neurogenic locus notch homolog protein 1-like n=1 Tax=Mya arenaria TaxID=6604 RepID=UPI0022E035DA|nr:neurogenic locus notch homolog protein 1-like [Mya arenaria]
MFDAVFLVVATVDLTQVNVTSAKGTWTHKSLNRYDVYQEVSGSDLTGTVVYSNKPVAVISGLGCSYSPNIHYVSGGCDHHITSLVPSSKGSSAVIVPSIYSQERFIARVLSDSTNTSRTSTICHHYVGNQTNCHAFSRANVLDSRVESHAVVVTGSEKFNVVQIKGEQGYMTWIPAVNQYLNEYVFVLPTIYAQQSHYISVIIPTLDISGLILDGILNPPKRLSETVPSPFSNYSVLTIDMNSGYHTIKHSNPAVKFGVICFGIGKLNISDSTASYGYPAGFKFETDWCEARPCLHGSRCVSGVKGYTCVCSMGYSGQRCENKVEDCASNPCLNAGTCIGGLNEFSCICLPGYAGSVCQTVISSSVMCYSCADMSHPGLCDTVKQCASGQSCMIQHSQNRFKSGCADSTVCSSAHNNSTDGHCTQCCVVNFCNSHGCGAQELFLREDRGPVCFDCGHVQTTGKCNTVQPCHKDQICGIEEYDWVGLSHFKMGCVDISCGVLDMEDSRRSVPVCKSCCAGDFCNHNCTRHSLGVIIG